MAQERELEPNLGAVSELKTGNVDISGLDTPSEVSVREGRKAGKLDVLIQGVALFSDGYNIQIIGYMNSILAKL